ncbi:MAG: type II CAAX endopeptidase family protein [Candidatus Bathyarchaeia archaeon]
MGFTQKVIVSSIVVVALSLLLYVPLFLYLGYGFWLHVASCIVFAVVSLASTLGLFREVSVLHDSDYRLATLLFVSLTCLVLAEELLLNSQWAVYGLGLALLSLILVPVLAVTFAMQHWLRVSLESIALVFATRVILSPFPLGFSELSLFLPFVYTLILVATILYLGYRQISSREARFTKGTHSWKLQLGTGISIGLLFGISEYFILRPRPISAGSSLLQVIVYVFVVLAIMVGTAEELLFRGLMQSAMEKVVSPMKAVGISATLFGLMHIGWMNPLEVLFAYGAGVVLGYLAWRMDGLLAPIAAHGTGNFILYLLALLPR